MNSIAVARARTLARSGAGRQVRLAAALSLREFADTIGVTAATLTRWERGLSLPRSHAAERWLAAVEALVAAGVVEPARLARPAAPRRTTPTNRKESGDA